MSNADEVIAAARSRTGLHDLGHESFHAGLVALLDGAEAAGSFNDLGLAILRDQVTGLLVTRLEVEDWYSRHPEIDEQEIIPPLFGIGLPRTGSTALSFLLGQDPRMRSLLAWESGTPTPPPDPATYDTDPRIAAAAENQVFIDQMSPKFKTMLPSSPTGPTECLQILALDFRSLVFDALGDNRHYEDWRAECDMGSAYRYHERVLKLLQWKFPQKPWSLKTPAHMFSLEALLSVYPDARFVMTHRDVVRVFPSLVSLMDATSEHMRTGPLAPDYASRLTANWEGALRRTLDYRDDGNDDRFFDIGFTEMRPEPMAAIARLYDWLGIELTDEAAQRMNDWWTENPSDKRGSHDYSPAQYGIDLDVVRAQFSFYNDRFSF